MARASTIASTSESADPAKADAETGVELSLGEQEVLAIFVQMTSALGMPRSLGEIYGLLYASPQPLAFQDIVDRLRLSKGSVSQGLRFLRTIGAIKPMVVAGDRREFFEPVIELRQLVAGFLRERLNPQIETWGMRAKALKPADFGRAGLTDGDLKTIEERLTKLKTWQKRAGSVLPVVSKLLG
jgi:HTH-type transcriptional regulator, glycine betaine synthesis regulator